MLSNREIQYRIRYDYPYLENLGRSEWTPAFNSYSKAHSHMNSYNVTAGWGRVLEVQTREVLYGEWEVLDNVRQ